MSHTHFVIICRECEAVIMECCCGWEWKPCYREICDKCKNKLLGFDIEDSKEK
jgi:hypothetical protein